MEFVSGHQRRRVVQQAADRVLRELAEAPVLAGFVEERPFAVGEAEVEVQPVAGLVEQGLRHERRDSAGPGRYLLDDVLGDLQVVGGLDHRGEGQLDLALRRSAGLVVVVLHRHAAGEHGRDHLAAQLVQVVARRYGLHPAEAFQLVAEVGISSRSVFQRPSTVSTK